MKGQYLFSGLLFLLVSLNLHAQVNVDSLLSVARTSTQDTIVIDAYYQVAKSYGTEAEALTYFDKAMKQAISSSSVEWQADIYNTRGIYYARTSAYREALNQWLTCVKLRTDLGDEGGVAQVYNNIGILYKNTGEYSRALEYYFKALDIADSLDDDYVRGKALGNLSIVYKIQGDFKQAEKYQLESLELARKIGNENSEASSLMNLGVLYGKMGRLEDAYNHLNQSLEIFQRLGETADVSSVYFNRSNIYKKEGKYDEALKDLYYDLDIKRSLHERKDIAGALINIGIIQIIKNESDEGIKNCLEGFMISDSLNVLEFEKNACKCLADGYEQKGNFKSALKYHQLYTQLRDSIYNEENTEELTQKTMQFEFEKERDAFELEQQRNQIEQEQSAYVLKMIIIGSIIGLIFMLIITITIYKNYQDKKRSNDLLERQKKEIEIKNTEKEILLREIHHRVKNNLQIVSSLLKIHARKLSDKESIEQLQDLRNKVNSMSLIHQKLYTNVDLAHIDFKDYVLDLCESLFESYKGANDSIELITEIDELDVDINNAIPLGLILNELITNSLKHAFKDGAEGIIKVELHKLKEGVEVVVSDNGSGINNESSLENSNSFGFQLIRSLSKKLNAMIEIKSNNGTQVHITIPEL